MWVPIFSICLRIENNISFIYILIIIRTKVLHGPLLCRGLRKVLQQINKFYIAMSSSTIFPF